MPQTALVHSDMKAAAFLLFALAGSGGSGRSQGRKVSGVDRTAIAVMIRRGMCHDNAAGSCATSASIASGERGALSANEPSGNEARIDAAHRFSAALLMLFGADDPASSAGLRYWPITHDLVLVHELCRHRQIREGKDERAVPGLAQDRIHMVMRQERGWLVIDSLKIDEACTRSACGRDAGQRMDAPRPKSWRTCRKLNPDRPARDGASPWPTASRVAPSAPTCRVPRHILRW